MEIKKIPKGVLVLGGINFFVLGFLFLLASFFTYQELSVGGESLLSEIEKYIPDAEIQPQQLKIVILAQMFVAVIFCVSGGGIFYRKEWARRLTVYFSFFLVVMAFFSVLTAPGLVRQAILQVIYPGILIFYFTNKKVEKYFIDQKPKEES